MPRTAARLASVTAVALTLAACDSATAPSADEASSQSDPEGLAATLNYPTGNVGTVRIPYPSVSCVGRSSTAGTRAVGVAGATVYPVINASAVNQMITEQVHLYRWDGAKFSSTGQSWQASITVGVATGNPVVMPNQYFTSLPAGHYKIYTRITWTMQDSFLRSINVGAVVLDYNMNRDYTGVNSQIGGEGTAPGGHCYMS